MLLSKLAFYIGQTAQCCKICSMKVQEDFRAHRSLSSHFPGCCIPPLLQYQPHQFQFHPKSLQIFQQLKCKGLHCIHCTPLNVAGLSERHHRLPPGHDRVPGCERVPHITDTPPQIASQAFLKGIASHPVLRECQAVSTFLLAPGCLSLNPAWTYLLNPPPSAVSQGRAPC